MKGVLFLVPNALDFGVDPTRQGANSACALDEVLPLGAIRRAAGLTHWVAENAKTTRAFLKRVNDIVPLAAALQSIQIVELPRGNKGAAPPSGAAHEALLTPALNGSDIGLISEAGLPAVADPGAALVQAAHRLNIRVDVLSGPNSLVMALAASGLNGQSFAFVGYLPVEGPARQARIRELETLSRRAQQTQLMIETPYRNVALLDALLATLSGGTRLSISCGLTLVHGWNRTDSVSAWKSRPPTLPCDIPAVFSILA